MFESRKVGIFVTAAQKAAMTAASAPSAANPFATIADLPAPDGNGIYTGSGSVPNGTVATLAGTLNFDTDLTAGISIGPTPFTTTHTLEIRANSTTSYTVIRGASNNATPAFQVTSSTPDLLFTVLNYGRTSLGVSANPNFGLSVGSSIVTARLGVRGAGNTSATINTLWESQDTTALMTLRDDGRLGINATPSTTNRVNITAGSGLDGAINISASNVASNGYGILIQGGTAVDHFKGVWVDITVEGAGINRAFQGTAHLSNGASNYGGYFSARNGTVESFGVYGIVPGGDSVDSPDNAGVLAVNASQTITNKRAVWGYLLNDVDGGTGYGGKFEAANQGVGGINYAVHGLANGSGATITNIAGFFQASGGAGAINHALVVPAAGGYILLGASALIDDALVQVAGSASFENAAAPTITAGSNRFAMYSADIVAGNAAPHFKTENGAILKIFQDTGWTLVTGTSSKSGYDTSTATLVQVAETVKAMQDHLNSMGILTV